MAPINKPVNKNVQLQVRVTVREKQAIVRAAKRAGMSVSAWVLGRLQQPRQQRLQQLLHRLATEQHNAYVLAELNDFLTALPAVNWEHTVAQPPQANLADHLANHVAAMVELASYQKGVPAPAWVNTIKPLQQPVFATDLLSVRLHLLTHAPPPFRRRNIFVDASVGDRV